MKIPISDILLNLERGKERKGNEGRKEKGKGKKEGMKICSTAVFLGKLVIIFNAHYILIRLSIFSLFTFNCLLNIFI